MATDTMNSFTAKDLVPEQEVKWCPGCGDYSILKQVQSVFPELGIAKENYVIVSGIGCSSRFPYYMETFGMHSIHGRAAVIASGVKTANPDLSVWVVTGDGDALAIGGNHFIHLLRRNIDLNVIMFNNQIYSLTKGQYSPTSEMGKVTKSTPFGTIETPFNPAALAIGAQGSFVARTIDRDPRHMKDILRRAHEHKGTSFVEVYQNCPIFNDGAFFTFTDKETKKENSIFVEQDKPLIFGTEDNKGIRLNGLKPEIVDLTANDISVNDLWIHDEGDKTKANLLTDMFNAPSDGLSLPRPFGVFYVEDRPVYEKEMEKQIRDVKEKKKELSLNRILSGNKIWEV